MLKKVYSNNAKSDTLIEYQVELKCSGVCCDNVREMLYKMHVCSFSDYIFAEFIRHIVCYVSYK